MDKFLFQRNTESDGSCQKQACRINQNPKYDLKVSSEKLSIFYVCSASYARYHAFFHIVCSSNIYIFRSNDILSLL